MKILRAVTGSSCAKGSGKNAFRASSSASRNMKPPSFRVAENGPSHASHFSLTQHPSPIIFANSFKFCSDYCRKTSSLLKLYNTHIHSISLFNVKLINLNICARACVCVCVCVQMYVTCFCLIKHLTMSTFALIFICHLIRVEMTYLNKIFSKRMTNGEAC